MGLLSLPDLPAAELFEAANANLSTHATWVQQRTAGMQTILANDLVLADSGLPTDTFNLICHARLSPENAPERIRTAVAHFAANQRPFAWWLTPGNQPDDLADCLLAAGLQPADTELAMAADLHRLPHDDVSPGGLQIRRARTTFQLRDFARTLIGDGDPAALRFYELAAPALLTPGSPLRLYIGYLAGVPVATAEVTIGGGVAGIYNVSTLPDYRRRGFGTALTLQSLLDAQAYGCRTAILQAAEAGVNLYTHLGFTPFGQITEYKPAGKA
jgi:ribosomal protein S18 acetylase RimI-like enzyme